MPVNPPKLPPGVDEDINEEQLLFDPQNPRLVGRNTDDPKELLRVLWKEMSVDEVALSIAYNGYFPEERLLVVKGPIKDNKQYYYVAEGNRRLAAVRLLRHPELQAEVGGTSLPSISAEARKKLHLLPCKIYNNRSEIWRYTGFRHINGVKPWDPYAKASYIAQIMEWEPNLSLDEIASFVGDRHDTVKRLYQGFLVLAQARKKGYAVEKNEGAIEKFSHLYTGIGYPSVRKFLGISGTAYHKKNPIPKTRTKNLVEYMRWLYGDVEAGRKAEVTTQNPDLSRLAEVIGNKQALQGLRTGGLHLDEAYQIAYGDLERLRGALVRAKEELQKARGLTYAFQGDKDTLGNAEKIQTLAGLILEDLREKVAVKVKAKG